MSNPRPRLVCFVDLIASDYVARVLDGMHGPLQAAGWDLRILEAGHMTWNARMGLLQRETLDPENSAAAFVHLHLTNEQKDLFHEARLPLGYLGGAMDWVHSVLDDGYDGAATAVRYLVGLGHRRIGFLIGDRLVSEARDREAGIRSAMLEALPDDLAKTLILTRRVKPALEKEGYECALELLKSAERPSALFCAAGDLVAAGAYQAAAKLGLRIPEDLSVLGYDDLPLAAGLQPPLSTLHQPLETMGATLAQRLIRAVQENIPAQAQVELIKPNLIERLSCAKPAQS